MVHYYSTQLSITSGAAVLSTLLLWSVVSKTLRHYRRKRTDHTKSSPESSDQKANGTPTKEYDWDANTSSSCSSIEKGSLRLQIPHLNKSNEIEVIPDGNIAKGEDEEDYCMAVCKNDEDYWSTTDALDKNNYSEAEQAIENILAYYQYIKLLRASRLDHHHHHHHHSENISLSSSPMSPISSNSPASPSYYDYIYKTTSPQPDIYTTPKRNDSPSLIPTK